MADQLRMDAVVNDKATGPLRKIREELAAFRETEGMKSLKENMSALREQTGEFAKAAAGASGIMGGMGIIGLGASLSIGKLVETFGDLGKRAGDLKSISQETGLAMSTIDRFGKVASRFGLNYEEMEGALKTWGDKMIEFRRHTGAIFNELRNQVDKDGRPVGAELIKKLLGENPEAQIQDIFKFLDTLAPQMRARYSELFFGDADISHMVRDGIGKLEEALDRVKAKQKDITPEFQVQAQAYAESLGDFNDAIDNFKIAAAPAVFAGLKAVAEELTKDFEKVAGFFNELKPVLAWLDKHKDDDTGLLAKNAIQDSVKAGHDALVEGRRQHQGEDGNALHRYDERPPPQGGSWFGGLFGGKRQEMAYRTFEDGGSSLGGGSGSQEIIQRAVRAGVLQGLQDYADMKTAQAAGGGGGSGFQSASYETGDVGGAGGRGIGSANLAGGDATGERADYIRSIAKKYGIDPRLAVAVANSEGLNKFTGDHNTSFGDFQLHVGGGLGDLFKKQTGLDPSDPKNWKQADDWALKYASKNGWGPWHGAARIGVTGMMGIGGNAAGDDAAPTGAPGSAVDHAMKLIGGGINEAARAFGSKMTPGEWCADFVNGAMKSAGMKGVNSSMALAFKSWGHAVGLSDAKKGDVVVEDHGGGHGHAGLLTGQVKRDAHGDIAAYGMVSGNHGNRVGFAWERPGEIAALRRANERPSLWGAAKGGGDGQQTVKHTGGAEITIKGLPHGTSTHSRTEGLINSVKLDRATTMPQLAWGSA